MSTISHILNKKKKVSFYHRMSLAKTIDKKGVVKENLKLEYNYQPGDSRMPVQTWIYSHCTLSIWSFLFFVSEIGTVTHKEAYKPLSWLPLELLIKYCNELCQICSSKEPRINQQDPSLRTIRKSLKDF